ncbi:MAG TPA: hypothetical protein VGL46_05150 [Pseudonocardiaceae bacterium]
MTDDQVRSVSNRHAIPVTCTHHGGPRGFANLVASKRDGEIELDPHVDGCCVILLSEDSARVLSEALVGWLG